MKRRILFVDDDVRALDALRGLLAPLEAGWDLVLAEGADPALARLEEAFDAVVVRLRMAEGQGRRVLEEAQRRHPTALRIGLAGPEDREHLVGSLGLLHQVFSSPFHPQDLQAVIGNAFRLGSQVVDPEVKALIARLDRLPTAPRLYEELCRTLEEEGVTVKAVGDIIRQDAGMAARILALVNSAFFGLRRSVESLQEAVAFLGTETIKALVLAHGLFDETGPLATRTLSLEDLWQHNLAVAKGARALAAMEGLSRALKSEAFMGGLLHDVGILVLAKNFPERYDRVVELGRKERLPVYAAEEREFGVGHAEVGAYLLGLWGIQSSVLRAVSLHHRPSAVRATAFNPVLAIHLADELCGARGHHSLFEYLELDERALALLGLRDRMPGWRKVLGEPSW